MLVEGGMMNATNNPKSGIRRFQGAMTGLEKFISRVPISKAIGIELGCYMGESTAVLAGSGRFKELHCVDAWLPEHLSTIAKEGEYTQAENEFDQVAEKYSVITKHKMLTTEFLLAAPMVDFVYIDASHYYEAVREDLRLSLNVLKPGGVLAGHDWGQHCPEVVQAIMDVVGYPDEVFEDFSWFMVMSEAKLASAKAVFEEGGK
jgi:predicted O-methyltransferase YrrM